MRKLLLFYLCLAGMSGCVSTYKVRQTTESGYSLYEWPSSVSINGGQHAQVYFRGRLPISKIENDLNAWRQTGLFSSVSQSYIDLPEKSGVFISSHCYDYTENDSDGGGIAGFFWLLSLGLMPARWENSGFACELELYQDAILISNTTTYLTYHTVANGWPVLFMLPFNESRREQIRNDSAAIQVNSLLASDSKRNHRK